MFYDTIDNDDYNKNILSSLYYLICFKTFYKFVICKTFFKTKIWGFVDVLIPPSVYNGVVHQFSLLYHYASCKHDETRGQFGQK